MADHLLTAAAKNGDLAALRARLEAGDLPEQGDTALLWAGYNGHAEIARVLVEYGANLAATDSSGNTAYTYAKNRGHTATAALLATATQQRQKLPSPEKWVLVGAHSVAFVGNYPEVGKKLTQFFNFETRQHSLISENLNTKSEGVSPACSFDDLAPQALEQALVEFARLGGKTDSDYARYGANSLGKPRKTLQEPGHG